MLHGDIAGLPISGFHCEFSETSKGLSRGAQFLKGFNPTVLDMQDRLDLQRLAHSRLCGAHSTTTTQVLEGVDVEQHRRGSRRRFDEASHFDSTRPGARCFRASGHCKAKAHGDRAAIDHRHRDGGITSREQRRLISSGHRRGEGRHDNLGGTCDLRSTKGLEESLRRRTRSRDRLQ